MRLAEKTIFVFALLCFVLSVLFYILNQYQIIFFPYQHELREAAVVPIVRLLESGKNPYDVAYQPYSFYAYGIGFPAIVSKLSFLELPALQTARIVATMFTSLSALLIFLILKDAKVKASLIMLAISIFLFEQSQYANLAFPNSTAVSILLLGYFAATKLNFTLTGCILGSLFFVLGFAVKQYVLIGLPVIGCYCLIRNGVKVTAIYASVIAVVFVAFVYWLNINFETYFIISYDAFKGARISSFYHMKDQMITFLTSNMHYVFALLCVANFWFLKTKDNWSVSSMLALIKEIDFFFIAFAAGLGAFIVKLGWHEGACCGLYLYHIATPFLLIFLSKSIDKYLDSAFVALCISALSLIYVYRLYNNYTTTKSTLAVIRTEVSGFSDKLSQYALILNSPEFTSMLKSKIYNNGSTEFFVDALNVPPYEKYKLTLEIDRKYRETIDKGIASKKFDLVQQTRGYTDNTYINNTHLDKYYYVKEVVRYPMLFGGWDVEFWVRK